MPFFATRDLSSCTDSAQHSLPGGEVDSLSAKPNILVAPYACAAMPAFSWGIGIRSFFHLATSEILLLNCET